MEVYDAVRTVLAVRSFQEKPVPAEILHRIVDAGRLSGSSMNRQPWHFIVVDDRKTINGLAAIAKTGPYIAQAAAAIVVAIEKNAFAESDASRAIQSMILTAWSAGLGSNWVGFKGLDDVNALLGIPDHLEVFAVIPLGYPAKKIGKGKKQRKPLSEVAHKGRFGQPFNG
jgi:nitroreductase